MLVLFQQKPIEIEQKENTNPLEKQNAARSRLNNSSVVGILVSIASCWGLANMGRELLLY
jgi:hypothetical protein